MIKDLSKTLRDVDVIFCYKCGVMLAERGLIININKIREMPASIASLTEGLCCFCDTKKRFANVWYEFFMKGNEGWVHDYKA